jgi:hypothetical protein
MSSTGQINAAVRIVEACRSAGRVQDVEAFLRSKWTLTAVEEALADNAPPPPWEPEEPEVEATRAQSYLTFMEELDVSGGPAPEARASSDPAIVKAWRLYDERKRQRAALAVLQAAHRVRALAARTHRAPTRAARRHRRSRLRVVQQARSGRGRKPRRRGSNDPGIGRSPGGAP